jgi:hypothetical protein
LSELLDVDDDDDDDADGPPPGSRAHSNARATLALVASIVATFLVYKLPQELSWPLVLLSTLAHELGHGIAAILVGGKFESLLISPDASGLARATASPGLKAAIVAAGGLVGPACAAALLFVLARRDTLARVGLLVLGAALLACVPLVLVGTYGQVFVSVVALVLLLLGVKAPAWLARLSLAFVAVQLSLSVYSRGDYLFTPVAHTATGDFPSDVANIAANLGLPYWLWGGLCGLFSVIVLLLGARLFLRGVAWWKEEEPAKARAPEPAREPEKLDPLAEIERIVKGQAKRDRA